MNRVGTALVWLCILVWFVCNGQGVIAYLTLEPTGSGFTRGSNRISTFLRWEVYALGVAIVALVVGRSFDVQGLARIAARWMLWISGGFFALLIVSFLGLIIWMRVFG